MVWRWQSVSRNKLKTQAAIVEKAPGFAKARAGKLIVALALSSAPAFAQSAPPAAPPAATEPAPTDAESAADSDTQPAPPAADSETRSARPPARRAPPAAPSPSQQAPPSAPPPNTYPAGPPYPSPRGDPQRESYPQGYPQGYPQRSYPQHQPYPQRQPYPPTYPQRQPYPQGYPQAQPYPYTGQPHPPPAPTTRGEANRATEPPEAAAERPSTVPLTVFRFGYGAYARGSLDFQGQCAGSCPLSLRNGEEAVSDHTPVLLGIDLMFGPEPLSLGFGFWFTTGTTLESDAHRERSIGWEFATPFMVGAALPVEEAIAVRFGLFGGPEFFFADSGSAQGRDGEAYENLCDDLNISECDVSSPTRFSWTYGIQAGPIFRFSRVGTLAAEAVVQRVDLELFGLDAEGANWRAKQTYDYGAWRLWLMITLGIGK